MIFLADEGVDEQIVSHLRMDGHEVLYVAEMDPGIPDDVVLSVANTQEALLITADKDFGELVFRQRRVTVGVVLLRLAGLSPPRKAEIVSSAMREHAQEVIGAFTVVSPGTIRIRPRAF